MKRTSGKTSKKTASILIAAITSLMCTLSCAAQTSPEIQFNGTTATVTNAPENSVLIGAFYRNGILTATQIEKGDIIMDFAAKLPIADSVKVFLWDMETIRPLCDVRTIKEEETKVRTMYIHANGNTLEAVLEDNDSTAALVEILKERDVIVDMSDYGGFEKVGSLGFSLPRNDTQIRTEPGDIILYNGNQLTIHYGNNSWSYTKLAKIENITGAKLKDALGTGDISVTLSLNK